MRIKSIGALHGVIELAGDKSISHRAAMLASVSVGTTTISNYSNGEDCASTLRCLRQLGVRISSERSTVKIEGVGKQGLEKPQNALDCGNSGTTMRLLSGILTGQPFLTELTGDKSLLSRPMERIAEPLRLSGARIETTDGHGPITIQGLDATEAYSYQLPVDSAQVKSCALFSGLNSSGSVTVKGSATADGKSTCRDHTERMLEFLGADILEAFEGGIHTVTISGESSLTARNLNIPADISSAAFFLVAAAVIKGSNIKLVNVGLNPTRSAILEILKEVGVNLSVSERRMDSNEPRGTIEVDYQGVFRKEKLVVRGNRIANLVDEIPILAILGTQLPGGLEIRDAAELRVKESDRIDAIVKNLTAMGARVTEYADGFSIKKSVLKGSVVNSYGDHRIAMAFAVAGVFAEGETIIEGSECASVSFPGFFDLIMSLGNNG